METDDRKPNKAARILLSPLILLNKGLTSLLRKAVGGNYGDNITEDDILSLVDAGNETGAIEDTSVEMINNVFEFNDLTASDVMTHRVNITAIEVGDSLDDIIYIALEKGFSRLPVYEGSLDKIIGIVIVKDLLCLIGDEHLENFRLREFIRDAVFIPESCSCSDTFTFLTSQKTGMAVVIDEYGGTAGIVTLEDLIESVMGNIQDEYDAEDMPIKKINDDKYEINGEADPDEVLELFGYELPDDHEYDTISGFVTDLLGYLPESSENSPHVDYKDIRFVIVEVCDNCAEKIIAFRNKTSEERSALAE
ncbi:MAG: hemolysin family protein [Bacteroides sp.]|nr:hemolysin family protein [Eubacterium sp.]MCM1417272.1 hemolysin family protein [Roseburia sp.]MCM1461108.1 hemolysin family protein [Bacteroides sp.]